MRIAPLAAKTLVNRGLADPDAARRFLAPSLEDLHDPLTMRDMPQAVERLLRAIRSHEKILIYGDYDVDGTTSVVLLTKAIEARRRSGRLSMCRTASRTAMACAPKWWKPPPNRA